MTSRLLLFGASASLISRRLLELAVAEAPRRGLVIAGVCDTDRRPPPPGRVAAPIRLGRLGARLVFGPDRDLPRSNPPFWSLAALARRAGAPLVVPPRRDVNDPAFVRAVREELRADLALVCACAQVFRRPLLDAFDAAVNYHNGLLPAYGGLMATSWSIYRGERETGFSYHRMTPQVDGGPLLLQGALPIRDGWSLGRLEAEKTRLAAAALPEVLGRLARRDPGRPQVGDRLYFGRQAWRRVRDVDDPSALPSDELGRRLRAFAQLRIRIDGRRLPVTAVGPARHGQPLAFRTADGRLLRPTRLRELPPAVHSALRRFLDGR
ncbi:MAG TPA: formyltransferase family protein [Gemmatimonadota bacterium]|jgi:methionyl-tRNA formyltransferase